MNQKKLKFLLVYCFLIRVWWIDHQTASLNSFYYRAGIAIWMPTPRNGDYVDVCPDDEGQIVHLPLTAIVREQDINCQCIRCLGDAPQFGCKGNK